MSVTINWNFTNYSDVDSVILCRSEVLNSEKAFEDSLNGITQGNFPDIVGSMSTSGLTEGVQSFTDSATLSPSTSYYYCVAAKGLGSDGLFKVGSTSSDASTTQVTNSGDGNSSVAVVTTAAESGGVDTTAPQTPTGLVAAAGDGEVNLSWDANSETDLAGYSVYRSTTSGGSYTQLTTPLQTTSDYTGLRNSSIANGTQYFYVITAVDTTGNESGYSLEVSVTPQASGAGSGAGSAPNYLVGHAFADLLGSYKVLYGDMPPTESGESYPGINFYTDVFVTQLDLVNSYPTSESILRGYIKGQLTSNEYYNTYGDIDAVPLFGSTEVANLNNRKSFVNRHLLKKGYAATSVQTDQAALRLWSYYSNDGMAEHDAIAYFLYNLATEPIGDGNSTYIVYTSPQIDTYRDTANDIGVAADAPWSDPN